MKRKFYTYRYLISNTAEQMSIFEMLHNKESLIKKILLDLLDQKKVSWNYATKRYIFTGIEKFERDIFIIKFARESINKIYVEDEIDIKKTDILEARYVYLIIDIKNQILLIEDKKSIFQDFKTAIKLINTFINEKIKEYNYHLNIFPLATKYTFWQSVSEAEKIYQLTLKLNAPNMAFFANRSTQRILKAIKDEVNNDELDLIFKNSDGNLEVKKTGIGTWIDYIREIGGKYFMKYRENGIMKTLSSNNDIYNVELEIDDELENNQKEEIKTKINNISELDNRE